MAHQKSKPLCFSENSIAHSLRKITTEQYISNLLIHLTGVRHPQDTPLTPFSSDGLSMTIQSCLFEPDFKYLTDTTPILHLLLSCWHDTLSLEILAPKILSFLLPSGIAPKILLAMMSIACTRQDLSLLRYCFSLSSSLSSDEEEEGEAIFWAATTDPIFEATTRNPDPIIWDSLLEYGLSRPNGRYWDVFSEGIKITKVQAGENHQGQLEGLAMIAFKDPRKIDLLNVLFQHGLVVTSAFLRKAKVVVGNDGRVMRMLGENLEGGDEDSVSDSDSMETEKESVVEVIPEEDRKEKRRSTEKDGRKERVSGDREEKKGDREEKKKHSSSRSHSDKQRDGEKKREKEHREHREHREHKEHREHRKHKERK